MREYDPRADIESCVKCGHDHYSDPKEVRWRLIVIGVDALELRCRRCGYGTLMRPKDSASP